MVFNGIVFKIFLMCGLCSPQWSFFQNFKNLNVYLNYVGIFNFSSNDVLIIITCCKF